MTDFDAGELRRAALAEISVDQKLAPVYDYWYRQCRESGVPRPADIDPTALPPAILSYLTLLDVIDGGRTFHIRLVGTANVAARGADFTGKPLEAAMSGDLLVSTLERYRAAVAQRRPILGYAEYAMQNGSTVRNLIMTLPLSKDGQSVDRLLGVFSPRSEWLAQQALRHYDDLAYRKPTRSFVVL